jgi:GMP synthase (glutamine-hydrolysing)
MASTAACPIAGMADETRRFYGVQFHPEVTHTRQGTKILQRFVREICDCRGDWSMPDYVGEAVQKIKNEVGKEEVILGLSGGVDSSVAAALIHRAIGAQLTCVFVDHGLLRLDEAKHVMEAFATHMHVPCAASPIPRRRERSSAGSSSRCSSGKRRKSATPNGSRRARSTRT